MVPANYYIKGGEDDEINILTSEIHYVPPVGTTTHLKKGKFDDMETLGEFKVVKVNHLVSENTQSFKTNESVEIFLEKVE